MVIRYAGADVRKTRSKAGVIDVHVGKRLRLRRRLLKISQEKLGVELDVSLNQVHKYEKGLNKLSAGKLYLLSHALNVPISYFYTGLKVKSLGELGTLLNNAQIAFENELLAKPETLKLIGLYHQLNDPVQNAVIALMGTIADELKRQDKP